MEPNQGVLGAGEPVWDWELLRRSCLIEARRLLRDVHEAEEAAQEAMTRAWRQRHACRDRHAPGAWLRRIARNEALRVIERRSTWRHAELTPDTQAPPGEGTSEADALVERLSVWQALEGLSSEDRHLVTLRYVLDLAHPEIAKRLGIPEATVRVRLHRIRKRLRLLMHERQ